MRAIVIDDSLTIRLALSKHLAGFGFTVEKADGGVSGLELLDQDPVPDLVLLDWNMPDMSGFDVLQALRKDPRLKPTKVMMVTSETDVHLMEAAIGAGANEYLMKPFNPQSLGAKLELLGLSAPSEG
ncbi:MAG TPA: response regulator [bacterium]|jgi:two-component system chemotaxis response regulator CheY|nr:response regulator [bacterium]